MSSSHYRRTLGRYDSSDRTLGRYDSGDRTLGRYDSGDRTLGRYDSEGRPQGRYDPGDEIYETRRREFEDYDRKLDRELGTTEDREITRDTRIQPSQRERTVVTVEHWLVYL